MATAILSMEIDEKLKEQSEILFSGLGTDLTSAVTLFLQTAVDIGDLPFEMKKADGDALLAASESLIEKNKESYRVLGK